MNTGNNEVIMPLYPGDKLTDQTFRLSVIKEHDAFLVKEAEVRRLLAKKHRRVANAVDGVSIGIMASLEAAGIGLIFTGIGAIPGAILSGLGLLVGVPVTWLHRRHAHKALKHARIMQCALDKRGSIHKLVSEALRDDSISPEEFDKISGEIDQYNSMKRAIQNKARSDDDDEAKKKLLQDYEEIRKKIAQITA